MRAFLLRRFLLAVVVLLGVSVFTFLAARVVPADAAAKWVGPKANAEQIARARVYLGLNDPLPVQYLRYLSGLVRGDWGESVVTHQPVLADIKAYLPPSLELLLLSSLLAMAVGIPLGILSARYQDRIPDQLSRLFAITGVSVPSFWLALLLQLLFFQKLKMLPVGGRLDSIFRLAHSVPMMTGSYVLDGALAGDWALVGAALKHLILPSITLAAYPIGLVTRMVRSSMTEVLGEDHIRAARAMGIPNRTILGRYALKPAMGPTATVLALSMAYSLSGTFLIEAVFAWPGLGRYAAGALIAADYPAIMGVTVLVATAYVVLNLLVDLTHAWLDPRISLR